MLVGQLPMNALAAHHADFNTHRVKLVSTEGRVFLDGLDEDDIFYNSPPSGDYNVDDKDSDSSSDYAEDEEYPDDEYTVDEEYPGYEPTPPKDTEDAPEHQVTVNVVAEDGNPIRGVAVRIYSESSDVIVEDTIDEEITEENSEFVDEDIIDGGCCVVTEDITDEDSNVVAEGFTNRDGIFIAWLTDGGYTVVAEHRDYEPAYPEYITVDASDTSITIVLDGMPQPHGFAALSSNPPGFYYYGAAITRENFLEYFDLNNPIGTGQLAYDPYTGILTLTENEFGQVGSTTLAPRIVMTQDFGLISEVRLGDTHQPDGADGIGFAFHPNHTRMTGNVGGALGIGGLPNAIGFKIDTFYNSPEDADRAVLSGWGYGPDPARFSHNPAENGTGVAFGAFVFTDGSWLGTGGVSSGPPGICTCPWYCRQSWTSDSTSPCPITDPTWGCCPNNVQYIRSYPGYDRRPGSRFYGHRQYGFADTYDAIGTPAEAQAVGNVTDGEWHRLEIRYVGATRVMTVVFTNNTEMQWEMRDEDFVVIMTGAGRASYEQAWEDYQYELATGEYTIEIVSGVYTWERSMWNEVQAALDRNIGSFASRFQHLPVIVEMSTSLDCLALITRLCQAF